jgi:hypothetical protein
LQVKIRFYAFEFSGGFKSKPEAKTPRKRIDKNGSRFRLP